MDVAATLRDARRNAGLTQAALAKRAGTSQATVSAYENGRKEPSVQTFARLLAATGSRLVAQAGHLPVIQRTPRDDAEAARRLADVLSLADLLPSRHEPELRYPRIATRAAA
jgi:transcriptional regulator with XRE-family HTH domain